MAENKNAKTPADGPAANRAMTLEEVQQWITTTWIRCQDEVWRQLPMPKKVSKDDVTPPKREWVSLTSEEVSEIIDREIGFNSCWGPEEAFARAIEAKLKEKNT
jgi:hypothetical protein